MAKVAGGISVRLEKPKRKRPGVHSKCKTSGLKSSKNYKKAYRGQGKQENSNKLFSCGGSIII